VPSCYLLLVCGGSSLDQHSNNVSLWNLVEQITAPPGMPPAPGGVIPLEIHAYFRVAVDEMSKTFETRYALIGSSGLETYSDTFAHRSVAPRYRTRTLGLPLPPVPDQYDLRIDCRLSGTDGWHRDSVAWPILFVEGAPRDVTKH
jgi:hypothetical protein